MRPLHFSTACLAPLTLSLFACAGGTDDETIDRDAGVASVRDGGPGVVRDGGPGAVRDGGPSAVRDGGTGRDAGAGVDGGTRDGGENPGCTYPANPAEPMALNRPISPYSWPQAIDGNGTLLDLDLAQVFCNNDGDIDWGDVDALLFVSMDAW